ncbi:hypothetical protein [uncultured Brevundimonas sp.]|uniref:hypothetical protein n=1 Tax=uncultured Brevundimonas sp. TaxID=213418 RepID=UPI0025DEC756|nr:hypothetical protein [uncultured Brevundimonas sp.]
MSALVIALLLGASSCEPTAADVGAAGGDAGARVWMEGSLRMNDIAMVGTHVPPTANEKLASVA